MKKSLKTLFFSLSLCLSVAGNAQTLESGYFLKDFNNRHELNPAFGSGRGYLSLPVIGHLNLGSSSNVGISDFLYQLDGAQDESALTTFMDSSVDSDEFLGNLNENNLLNADGDVNILSFGFLGFNGFNNIGINLRSRTQASLPLDLFRFMKSGQPSGKQTRYELRDVSVSSDNFVDISLNHSHQIGERLRIGATLKVLLGVGGLKSHINNMSITTGNEKWVIDANGSLDAALKGMVLKTDDEGRMDDVDFNAENLGISGIGFGMDLGASFKLLDNLTLSASLDDIGAIRWKDVQTATMDSEPYEFDGFTETESGESSDQNLEALGEDLQEWAKYDLNDGTGTYRSDLSATLRVGAEYELPSYRSLSFALLSTTRFCPSLNSTQLRAFASIAPADWFEASVNGGWSTFGGSLGFIFNIHPGFFNIFAGSDWLFFKRTPQGLPTGNMNTNICAGIQFLIGRKA